MTRGRKISQAFVNLFPVNEANVIGSTIGSPSAVKTRVSHFLSPFFLPFSLSPLFPPLGNSRREHFSSFYNTDPAFRPSVCENSSNPLSPSCLHDGNSDLCDSVRGKYRVVLPSLHSPPLAPSTQILFPFFVKQSY